MGSGSRYTTCISCQNTEPTRSWRGLLQPLSLLATGPVPVAPPVPDAKLNGCDATSPARPPNRHPAFGLTDLAAQGGVVVLHHATQARAGQRQVLAFMAWAAYPHARSWPSPVLNGSTSAMFASPVRALVYGHGAESCADPAKAWTSSLRSRIRIW